MSTSPARKTSRRTPSEGPILTQVFSSLPNTVLVIDEAGVIRYANLAAEQLLGLSASHLCGMALNTLIPEDSMLYSLVRQALDNQSPVSQYGATLDTPRTGAKELTIQVAPLVDGSGWVVLSILEHTLAQKIGQQLSHRGAARTVSAMAALMAHEIKNPLSGIRGAAQLLESVVSDTDRPLTALIRDETDRIVKLVDSMEIFSDQPLQRDPVNIHQVLEHVRRIAETGFARGIQFIERYDPSLPPVSGNRDQLIQVLLNLVKNAAEACPEQGGEIVLTTSYQHGVRVALPGAGTMLNLPLVVTVQDNGNGIPDDMREHLFDPFITTKAKGSGLGLALVAKVVHDHGGIVEFESQPRRTIFRIMLPIARSRPSAGAN